MAYELNFTKSGMGISEGTVVRWLKGVGDIVQQDELLCEIETAKAVQEITAPAAGKITEILVAEGEEVPVNTALAIIGDSDE